MKTIRRLYFYLVAAISLEVVLWGLINLLRTTFAAGLTFPGADTLAQALALIFVGVPIFAVHWLWAQRASAKDPEEASAGLRAMYLYAVLLMTLIPVAQNLLALINRTFIVTAGIDTTRAFLGGSQSWIDNTIAILLNLLAAAYFYNILRTNWATLPERENFAGVRRLYRYIWLLYGLLMATFGIQQVIRFIFSLPTALLGATDNEMYINGLALVLVGAPIWVYTWNLCQTALSEPGESGSNLRLGVLYILALSGVVTVLTVSGVIINTLLQQALGAGLPWGVIISRLSEPISVGVPLAVIWAYYGGWLTREIAAYPEAARRASLKRFYYYILSSLGLIATFTGLALLLSFIVSILTGNTLWGDTLRTRVSDAISILLAGLPLWILAWRSLQLEAAASSDLGDHARRSIVRRAYLYLAIFTTVIGGMASAIYLVYTILFGFLDHLSDSFLTDVLNGLQLLCLFSAFLLYHWSTLRQDGSRAASALATRQSRFAVLIFEPNGSGFAAPLLTAIQRASAAIPVAVQPVEQGIPEGASGVQAVILSSALALDPPEALRLWLRDFSGAKLVVPQELPGWYWPAGAPKNAAANTAQIIRQLAEGQEVRVNTGGNSALQTAAYICAILFGVELLFVLFGLGMSLISGR